MDAKEFFEIYEKLQPMKEPIKYKHRTGAIAIWDQRTQNYKVDYNDRGHEDYLRKELVEESQDWKLVGHKITIVELGTGRIQCYQNDSFYGFTGHELKAIENLLNGEEKEGYTEEDLKSFGKMWRYNKSHDIDTVFKSWKEFEQSKPRE